MKLLTRFYELYIITHNKTNLLFLIKLTNNINRDPFPRRYFFENFLTLLPPQMRVFKSELNETSDMFLGYFFNDLE